MPECVIEHNKYAGIGATIFLTSVLASLSAAYAIYAGFSSISISLLLGLLWGLLIFNLDRYIVSTIRKNIVSNHVSSTRRLTSRLRELLLYLPRILLAVFIGTTIAVPLELKFFEREINAQIDLSASEKIKNIRDLVDNEFVEVDKLNIENQNLKKEISDKQKERDQLFELAINEATGRTGPRTSGRMGKGILYQERKKAFQQSDSELRQLRTANERKIEENNQRISYLTSQRDLRMREVMQRVPNSIGLTTRLQALNNLAITNTTVAWVRLVLVLLFVLLVTSPILVNLLSQPGPYDYVFESLDRHAYRKQQDKRSEIFDSVGLTEVAETHQGSRIPLPLPPSELVEACAAGECVLYGGAGLGAQAGLPTWRSFLRGMLNWAVKQGYIDRSRASSFNASIDEGRSDAVADSIYNELQRRGELPALHNYLSEVFLSKVPLPVVYHTFTRIPLAAILTTNFDDLFERNYQNREAPILTPNSAEQLNAALSKYQFFILKLYGTLSRNETVMVAPVQYEDAVTGNRNFSEFMETLFFSKTILFVGSSLEGIEAYLKGITLPKSIPRTHYALVAVGGNAWQAQADVLKRRYGIEVLPFTPTEGFPEIQGFLEGLAEGVAARPATVLEGDRTKSRLKRIVLENIGPFEHLELELDPKWNILLGDNGVGKSTILKAVALAICGKDAQPFARQLIRSGKESALIILETDRNTVYETQIHDRNGIAEISSKPARPLEIENWLVVGFPPLRTASWERPKGPEMEPRKTLTPSAEDALPLVRGGLDPRMDKLKQWIVNLDYWKSKREGERVDSGNKYDELIQEFFALVDHLTIDLKLHYKGIDETYGIRVETSDGEIPIESVSQGATSLTGWVGILLQRLNEVYGNEDDPKSKYALVLMDEIDAHMHPTWQQSLVRRLSEKFTGLQFLATTHSPLIIGGMRPRQLFRFMRGRDGKIIQIEVDREMALGRADQVLTGDLFGLDTTIDPVTQERIEEYQELLGMSAESRTKEQELKLRRLRDILGFRIPETGETTLERRAQELLTALLLEQFEDEFPQVQQRILQKAQRLFAELTKQKELRG